MPTARTVPVTVEMDGDELDAEDAWHQTRRIGWRRLVVDSFVRFRYGDGFSHSRALALQASLSAVPFLLALSGLVADLDRERPAAVLAATVAALSPGAGDSDALVRAVRGSDASELSGEIALWLGLLLAFVSMTTAVAQVERGLNRIYGIERDRPAMRKYARAAVLTGVLALPIAAGVVLLLAGGALGDALAEAYGWDGAQRFGWVRWPVGVVLVVLTVAVLLDHSPRRRQPGLSWLAVGAAVAVLLTLLSTGLLAAYAGLSPSFGDVYGPLGGVVALLLWTLLTSVALFYGGAVCAQLEACRAGQPEPTTEDPGRPSGVTLAEDRGDDGRRAPS